MKLSNGLELTAEQESNLRKLALYHLRGFDISHMGFTMALYSTSHGCMVDAGVSECGSVGCLVGHGPLAGIKSMPGEFWRDYSHRVFLSSRDEWNWCFNQTWFLVDNTPSGGAKRILWLLEFGLPENWEAQMDGRSPLCYRDWTPTLPPEIVEHVPERTAVGV